LGENLSSLIFDVKTPKTLEFVKYWEGIKRHLGWSQSRLAEKMDVTASAVSTWIGGQTNPSRQTMNHLRLLLEKEAPIILVEIREGERKVDYQSEDVSGGAMVLKDEPADWISDEHRKIVDDVRRKHRQIEDDLMRNLKASSSPAARADRLAKKKLKGNPGPADNQPGSSET
jgi:transcriptional regulator with XRE-family HTH domain